MCDGGYELFGSGGACAAGTRDVVIIHHPFNPVIDGKIRTLNENDYDVDTLFRLM